MKLGGKLTLCNLIVIAVVLVVPALMLVSYVLTVPYENRLVEAAAKDDTPRIKALLKRGVSLDAQEIGMLGQTPLIAASISDGTNAFFYLLSSGAKVNARDRQGRSALMAAVMLGDANLLKTEALITAGADVNARDGSGLSVLKYAKDALTGGHPATRTISLLEGRGARD